MNGLFFRRRKKYAEMPPNSFPRRVAAVLTTSIDEGRYLRVTRNSEQLFEVQSRSTPNCMRIVNTANISCTCGFPQETKLPCRHLAAALMFDFTDPHTLVVGERRVEALRAVYAGFGVPVESPSFATTGLGLPPFGEGEGGLGSSGSAARLRGLQSAESSAGSVERAATTHGRALLQTQRRRRSRALFIDGFLTMSSSRKSLNQGTFSTLLFAIVATLFHRACATAGLDIYVFNVGQADSQLIVFPSGYNILVNAGETSTRSMNCKAIVERIISIFGKPYVDVGDIMHLHIDHVGYAGKNGLYYLM